MLCNDAELFQQDGAWKVEGDPTEGALYPFATKLGMERQAEQAASPRIDAIPFESEHRFMATLHKPATGARGALRQGRARGHPRACDRQQTRDGAQGRWIANTSWRRRTSSRRRASACWRWPGSRIRRVEAGRLGPADLPKNLVLLGLIGLLDPPRKEAIEAVKECHGGGIRVTMITGDHKITAAAIAKMLGIGDGRTAITGAEIEEMDTATLQERVRDVDVFARASPEHKLRLVKAIQANKQIVAMTGDGVNDAPSLKKADIGVAMGIKGTEVTKEAAEMVLADDNFASITAAVKEGRTVYNNIEKAILFMLPTNVAQALVIAVAIFLGFTMPITAPQVLWVNMVTSVALGLVISFEPHELDVMQRSPRAVDRPILTGFGIWRVVFVGLALLAYTLVAFFWMKWTGGLGRAGADGRGQRDHRRAGLLPAQQPLPAGFVALDQGASRQPVPAARHRRGRRPAAPVHLRPAAATPVRQRSHPAPGLAMAPPRRPGVLPRRGGREGHHPLVGLAATRGHRGGSGNVGPDARTASRQRRSAAIRPAATRGGGPHPPTGASRARCGPAPRACAAGRRLPASAGGWPSVRR